MVILVGVGAVTDILDGRAARRYLGEDRQGKLGKYDLDVDTFFILCIVGYLTISGIVIPWVVGLGWIGLALIAAVVFKRDTRVMLLVEVPSVVALLVSSLVYDLAIFLSPEGGQYLYLFTGDPEGASDEPWEPLGLFVRIRYVCR